MKIISDSKNNFSELEFKINQGGIEQKLDFKSPFRNKKEGLKKEPFSFELSLDQEEYSGSGAFGQDALWFPINEDEGIKVVRPIRDIKSVEQNVNFIKSLNSDIFPKIDWVESATVNGLPCVVMKMENVTKKSQKVFTERENYLDDEDKEYIRNNLNVPLWFINKCVKEFNKHHILPEFTWYKNGGFSSVNIIGGKIVDFHMFRNKEDRYVFPSNGLTYEETEKIYNNALERYKKWIPFDGVPKWKGKIYQAMSFNNGFNMPGYSSDGETYDSHIKIHFMPLDRISGGNVIEFGSNQGFFCTQAALHGAKNVKGVEITNEDVELACEIRDNLTKLSNIEYLNGDARKIIKEESWYELIILSSVLHQLYPNIDDPGCDEFLNMISEKCTYFFFETPIKHKHYNYSLEQVTSKLEKHFKNVRLVYAYDCYSTGYRAIFICRPVDPTYNKNSLWKGHGTYE